MVATRDRFFDDIAQEYDSIARRGMPRRDEMLAALYGSLPNGANDVLELGCGNGVLTHLLAERYPDARITAVDASDEMLTIAAQRLPDGRVTFVTGTFETLALADSSYDVIASNMALHHVFDKAPVYRALARALRPGGTFVLGDELLGVTHEDQERTLDAWLRFARRPGGLSDDEIAATPAHMDAFDHYETLPAQLELLGQAGFQAIECRWHYLIYGVFRARTPVLSLGT